MTIARSFFHYFFFRNKTKLKIDIIEIQPANRNMISDELSQLINDDDDDDDGGEQFNRKDVDEILVLAGGFGRFQLLLLIVCMFICNSFAYQGLAMYYAADDSPWRCTVNATNEFCQLHPHQSVAQSSNDFKKRCEIPRDQWEYVTPKKYSIVTEYELVCRKQYLKSLTSAMFFVGSGLGSIMFGPINDIYGRKLGVCVSLFLLSVSSFCSCFISEVWQFILLRTFIGISFGGANIALYVLLSESVPAKKRSVVSNIYQIAWGVSVLILTLLAYYIRDWRKLLFCNSFTGAVSFFLSLGLFESPNWLYTKGRPVDALKVLTRISKINRKNISSNIRLKEKVNEKNASRPYSYLDLFNNLKVFLLVSVQCFLWFSASLMEYGMSFANASLGGSIYFNFAFSSMAMMPSIMLVIPATLYIGRRKCICLAFLLSALLTCGIGFVPENYHDPRIALAFVIKVILNIAFSVLYIWSFEIFPTVLRSQGMNVCQISTRVGGAMSPFVVDLLKNITLVLPFLVMAGAGIGAAMLGLLLPETLNKPIRQTYENMLSPTPTTVPIEVNDVQDEDFR